MSNIVIRKVEEDDISSIAEIQTSGWKTAYRGIIDDNILNALNETKKIEKLKSNYQKNGFVVAELNNEIVGFCRYVDSNEFSPNIQDADCEITALYVKPDLKYNGIGTKLFNFVADKFKTEGKTKMILWCLKDNGPSKKFYTKMGGRIIRERTTQIGGKTYSEVGFAYNIQALEHSLERK